MSEEQKQPNPFEVMLGTSMTKSEPTDETLPTVELNKCLCRILAALCDQFGGGVQVSHRLIALNLEPNLHFEDDPSGRTLIVSKEPILPGSVEKDRSYGDSLELGISLRLLIQDQADWSRSVFGSDEVRGPLGPLKHLAKEVQETIQAIENDDPAEEIAKEFADLLILFLDASRRAKYTVPQLVLIALDKMKENRARKWQTPTSPDEPVEHVRD
jgi:hypothetical protein